MTAHPTKVLLLGGTGLLGCSLAPSLVSRGYSVVAHGNRHGGDHQADLTRLQATHDLLESCQPDVIVNLVGLTDVDLCEQKPTLAYAANVRVAENVADWIRGAGTPPHLVQVSTDQVYDGTGPHAEPDVTLTNYYAFAKYATELAALNVQSTVLRTNFFGRSRCPGRTSLTDWLHQSLRQSIAIKVFDDVHFSPLSITSLCDLIARVIERRPRGVFNLGSHGGMSKADFAFAFAQALALPTTSVSRASVDSLTSLRAYRPRDMRMDCCRFETSIGLDLPSLREEIKLAAKDYHEAP